MNGFDKLLLQAGSSSMTDLFLQLKEALMNRDLIRMSVLVQRLQEELEAHNKIIKRITTLDVS